MCLVMTKSQAAAAGPIPVTIVTGFLGSGKTTVLNALLRDPAFAGSAVLINEFGDVQIDHDLVAGFSDELVMTTTGCMCCTASSDIRQSLYDLWTRRRRGDVGRFGRVIVETTGLMDPVPVINSLLVPPRSDRVERTVHQSFVLSRVITLFDIVFGPMTLDRHEEAIKQVGLADAILLTKTDLARDPGTLSDIASDKRRLSNINRGARVLDRHADWGTIRDLFLMPTSYSLRGRGEDVTVWLDADDLSPAEDHHHGHGDGHDHSGHHHIDVNRHGEDICSHALFHDGLIPNDAFGRFLDFLKASAGTDLLRMKGIFGLSDDFERPVVVHGVQHTVFPIDKLANWPSEDRRTKIVLIGRNLDIGAFRAHLAAV